jgi:hypothetical protein
MSEVFAATVATSAVSAFVTYGINMSIDRLRRLIENSNTPSEDKALFIELKDTLEYHQTLSTQLEDSEFIQKRNLSLWLHDKLHTSNFTTGNKPPDFVLNFHK